MAANQDDVVRDAIARNCGLVLSLPSAGMLRHHKSRFLTELEGGILVQAPADETPLINELIQDAKPCGVSFKHGVNKVIFAARVRRVEPEWRINDQTIVTAMLIDFPAEIKSTQRRSNYRVKVPATTELSARVWRIAERTYIGDQPMAAQEIKAELRDISLGGIGVKLLPKDGQPPRISKEDRLRVQLNRGGTTFLLEGRMRDPGTVAANDALMTGIQFKKLENDLKGRQTLAQLTRIVGELQREEARRVRLGMMQSA
jgi:c-di-GMP-binding flagellar brake protein YcgR